MNETPVATDGVTPDMIEAADEYYQFPDSSDAFKARFLTRICCTMYAAMPRNRASVHNAGDSQNVAM
jgi:hypothetical protein